MSESRIKNAFSRSTILTVGRLIARGLWPGRTAAKAEERDAAEQHECAHGVPYFNPRASQ